jgi:hypothetical protein
LGLGGRIPRIDEEADKGGAPGPVRAAIPTVLPRAC